MDPLSPFLTVVVVARNQASQLDSLLERLAQPVGPLVRDYELVVVDNASEDESVARYKALTADEGRCNLQVYALTQEVDADTAAWVGVENALGDHVVVINPQRDDLSLLPEMLRQAAAGADVVFAQNRMTRPHRWPYRLASAAFHWLYQRFCGIHLAKEAPAYRLLSRQVIQFVLQHPNPVLAYRYLPATAGFARVHLTFAAPRAQESSENLWAGVGRGVRLLIATTSGPMRLVTGLSFSGALLNFIYSGYVIAIGLFKADVQPGWVTLSLQQSGMFFLLSLVLMVLGEYVAHNTEEAGAGPRYHVAQEFTSARMTRRERLNVQEASVTNVRHAG